MAENKTRIVDAREVEWQDGAAVLTLPEGVRVKILAEDKETGRTDMLINFPPGYVEPRHTHTAFHSCVLLEGRWIVEGKELAPGGYMFGPPGEGQPHGPFECPEGCIVFVSFHGGTGDGIHHNY
ncbi:MAG: cupin domain-containing protein [Dehalococcoidia bacterium]